MCRVLRCGPQRLVYVSVSGGQWINTRQQFTPTCESVVLAAFTRSKQRYGAPRLTDELRAQGYL
nr:Transposase InsF for insertion sequence IS3 [Escherichia coli]